MTAPSPPPSHAAVPSRVGAVLTVAGTELQRLVRDRTALFFIVVLPVVIIIIVGSTIGAAPSHAPVGVIDLDRTESSRRFLTALEAGEALALVTYPEVTDLQADIRIQNLIGGVVIPAGYEAAVTGGRTATVTVYADQTQSSTGSLLTVVTTAIEQEGGQLAAASFAAGRTGADPGRSRAEAARLAATLPTVEVKVETVGKQTLATMNKYDYTAPSNLVLFVFINSLTGAAALVETRRLGITRRVLAAPVPASTALLGGGACHLVVALIQSALILGVGRLVFGVQWGDPLAATLLTLVFALLGTGAGLFIGSVVRTPEQATSIGIPLGIGMAMLGGCMWPLEVVPQGVRALGHLTPHAWAMDAWIALIFDRKGLVDIAPNLGILAAIAVALIGLASWRLRRLTALGA